MKIAVIGVGGVGGYFGGKLTQLLGKVKDLQVYFVARGAHLSEITAHGLLLDTDEGQMICSPTLATDSVSDLPVLDLCLICVKGYDLENVLLQLKSKINENTMILPLLNGVDIYERIRSVISDGIVFPSCVYIGTHIEKPGKVTQRGGATIIHFGKDPKNEYVAPELFELFHKANIKQNFTDAHYIEIWSKFIFIAAYGLVTAYSNKTIGEVFQSDELSGYVKNIMTEVYLVAVEKGVSLQSSIIDEAFSKGSKFPFELKTSFQRDYEKKDKPDERDLFGGTIIRMGEQVGVETETTKLLYAHIEKNKIKFW